MDDRNIAGAVLMRVGVCVGRRPVCASAGVADADRAREGALVECLAQVVDFAGVFAHVDMAVRQRDAGGGVPAVLQFREAVDECVERLVAAGNATDDAAYQRTISWIGEIEAKAVDRRSWRN